MTLQVNIVLEILGRPAEHIKEALLSLITRIQAEKGVTIKEKKIYDPVAVEKTDLFTSFVEINAEIDSVSTYLGIIFAYLPSHIEIISPEKITLTNSDLNSIGNALAKRLHDYDAVAKRMIADKDLLLKKLYEVAPHMFKQKPQVVEKQQKKEEKKNEEEKSLDKEVENKKEKKSKKSRNKDKTE